MHYTITKPTYFQLYFLLNHFSFVTIIFFLDKFQEDTTEHYTTAKPINIETNNFRSPIKQTLFTTGNFMEFNTCFWYLRMYPINTSVCLKQVNSGQVWLQLRRKYTQFQLPLTPVQNDLPVGGMLLQAKLIKLPGQTDRQHSSLTCNKQKHAVNTMKLVYFVIQTCGS